VLPPDESVRVQVQAGRSLGGHEVVQVRVVGRVHLGLCGPAALHPPGGGHDGLGSRIAAVLIGPHRNAHGRTTLLADRHPANPSGAPSGSFRHSRLHRADSCEARGRVGVRDEPTFAARPSVRSPMPQKSVIEKDRVVVRFAGDSGDGMQLTGDRFTNATAVLGNDLATLPDFPAEIRAPAGTLAGVSAFQIHFAALDILTPGDRPNVLVAMNPAALKTNLKDLESGGIVIVNEDAFIDRNLEKAGYEADPLGDGSLDGYQVYRVPMTSITLRATEGIAITKKEAERSKNFFALGLLSWMYGRPTDVTTNWIEKKFGAKPMILEANLAAFKAGYNFGETTELFAHTYEVKPAPALPGTYRNISGSTALAWGLVAASVRSGLPIFYASYPITPASELLHELSRHKNFGVRTLQAEDEIAAAGAALGASFGGHLGIT